MGFIVPSAWRAGVVVAALLASGCARSGSIAAQSPTQRSEPTGVTNAQPASPADAAAWNVLVSGDVLQACHIPTSEGSFPFDPYQPSARARATMSRVSTCVRSGPLAGRMLHVVGHADLIGRQPQDGEKIGLWRAEGVRRYLALEGAPASATAGSPPDVEAQDDTGIAYERRVDIELAP
ncbi:MAG TPA: hypothetical protein VGG39_36780 [Polyangiaceae bacterium]|jgi:outer membrane protein OmpA-like peptidoglycan-associated protein